MPRGGNPSDHRCFDDMHYDVNTVAMLRAVLDETLASEAFYRQNQVSAVDLAQHILRLASKGERNAAVIKSHIGDLLMSSAAAA